MPQNTQHTATPGLWHHLYETALDAVESAALDARAHCIGTPLPLTYQTKLFKLTKIIKELEELDPRNLSAASITQPAAVQTDKQTDQDQPLPFKIGDKVYCRHIRTTGEIIGIGIYADQSPQARILSLFNGKLSQNWISMSDLEPPLRREDMSRQEVQALETEAAACAVSQIPLLHPSPQSAA